MLTSETTLRFRGWDEVHGSLAAAGFDMVDIRDAPDRPGRELVFLARHAGERHCYLLHLCRWAVGGTRARHRACRTVARS